MDSFSNWSANRPRGGSTYSSVVVGEGGDWDRIRSEGEPSGGTAEVGVSEVIVVLPNSRARWRARLT